MSFGNIVSDTVQCPNHRNAGKYLGIIKEKQLSFWNILFKKNYDKPSLHIMYLRHIIPPLCMIKCIKLFLQHILELNDSNAIS